ncbi:GAF domain-containing protein, partial [bacterium]|nr:GAF domain-containing protein [bacterium]
SKVFPSVDTNFLYLLNKILGGVDNLHGALDSLVPVIRPYFIFDNVVVFLIDPMTLNLDVAYARATGRGKSAEADVAWGEIIGTQVVESRQSILQEPQDPIETDRLRRPHTLGVPLITQTETLGAIIFIRFGSPQYTPEQIAFAEYLADQLAVVAARENLKNENRRLEFQYRTFQVQEDFISTLSHELRTPLGFIKGYTTTLLRTDANWDDQTKQEFLTIIDQETDRLQDLLSNLLDSAKLQSGQIIMDFQVVRLDALIKDVILRSRLHHPALVVDSEVEEPIKNVQADPRRLAQILENLINNAVKYAPNSPVMVKIYSAPNGVTIDVIDKGPGIPEKYQGKIFERFFRIPESGSSVHGSGLGLFICKQIVQAHNGTIELISRIGEGCTFRIFFPDRL